MPSLTPDVIAVTDRWIVVSKPAGWLSIPGRRPVGPSESEDTSVSSSCVLHTWLESQHGKTWVVHRLDRETSGVILFARSAEAHREANQWFQSRQVRKLYHCLAVGVPAVPVFRIREKIRGVSATTQVEVKERYSAGFLAHIRPLTGRRHQIRIHLSGAGHPLWGDRLYGGPSVIQLKAGQIEIGRTALHAARLELPSGEVFEAPWPEDFRSWVEKAHGERQEYA